MSAVLPQPYLTPYSGLGVSAHRWSVAVVTAQAGAAYADADTITINGVTYEADTNNDDVVPGNVDLDLTPADTAEQARDKLLAAIIASDAELIAEAFGLVGVRLRHTVPGESLSIAGLGGFAGAATGEVDGRAGSALQPAIIGELRAVRLDDAPRGGPEG